MLVAGAALMAIGASIPFFASSLSDAPWSDDWDELAPAIAGNPSAWMWANLLFLASAIATAFGLWILSKRFEGKARVLADTGALAFTFAAVLSLIDRIISISVASWAAEASLPSNDTTVQAFIRMDEGFSMGFFVLGFLAVSLFGLAMTNTSSDRTYGGWITAVGVLGILTAIVGFAIPAFVYLATTALGVIALTSLVSGADNPG